MDNTLFSKSFSFNLIVRSACFHTDNSAGISCNFIARLRRGHVRIVSDEYGELSIDEGEVFLLPFGLRYHSYWTARDGAVEFESYRFDFYPSATAHALTLQKVELNEDETALLDLLFEDMQISPTSVGRLFTLLGAIMPRLELAAVDPRQRLYEKAKQYISECSVLRVPELARFLAMSESGVYAFFRSFGKTPIEVKNEILTERAVTLLSSTDMSVEQICGRVGFSSVAYFRKTVRRISGKTPTEIRRESRKNSSV